MPHCSRRFRHLRLPPASGLSGAGAFAAYVSPLCEADIVSRTKRLNAPKSHQRLALWLARNRVAWTDWRRADPDALMAALNEVQAFKPDSGLEPALRVAASLGGDAVDDLIIAVSAVRERISVERLQSEGLSGPALGRALDSARREQLVKAQTAR